MDAVHAAMTSVGGTHNVGLRRACLLMERSGRHHGRRWALAIASLHGASPVTQSSQRERTKCRVSVQSNSEAVTRTLAQPQLQPPIVPNAAAAARSLFAALNRRDVSALLSLLDTDVVYENLGSASACLRGRADVGRFYLEALAGLPEEAVFVLEGRQGQGQGHGQAQQGVGAAADWREAGQEQEAGELEGPVLQAGVVWHMELHGVVVPLSRGVGVYTAHPATGRLVRIVDSPEHAFKLPGPLLTMAGAAVAGAASSQLLRGGLGPLVLPAARGVSSFLESLAPGSGGGGSRMVDPAAGLAAAAAGGGGGGGGGGGTLADSLASVLNGMLPFQRGPIASAAGRPTAATAAAITSSSSSSGTGGGGGGARMLYRDHTRPAQGTGAASAVAGGKALGTESRGRGPAGRAGPAPSAAAAAASVALTASAPQAPPAGSTPPSRPPSDVSMMYDSSGAGASPARGNGVAASAANAGAGAATSAAADSGAAAATSSRGELIPMRPLTHPDSPSPSPAPSPSPPTPGASRTGPILSAAVASTGSAASAGSMASTDGGGGDADEGAGVTPGGGADEGAGRASSGPAAAGGAGAAGGGHGDSGGGGGDGGAVSMASAGSSMDDSVPSASASPSPSPSVSSSSGAGSAPKAPWALPFAPSTADDVGLTGLWEKDAEASQVQEYEAMLDVFQLGGLQKVTARLIDGLDLRQDGQRFEVSFVTVVPFFRVTEKSLFGQTTTMGRRDLRDPITGRQTSTATRVPGGVVVDMSWGAPLAGSLREQYLASQDGSQMAVTSTLRIGDREASATQVYRRSARNKNDFLASQRSAYGTLEDVLNSQEKKYGKINY